jgi:hypothetical protein
MSRSIAATIPDTAKLCYIDGGSMNICQAYFTTQPLQDQWGDDWDDAPYELNAEEPYNWKTGTDEPHSIFVVVFNRGQYWCPCDGHLNSPWSVQDINAGRIPWLSSEKHPTMMAGCRFAQFSELISAADGTVYSPYHQY